MDGTGQLLRDFAKALHPDVDVVIVSYPGDAPFDYKQLETFVRERLPADSPFLLFAESFSGPIAVSTGDTP
jgi:hypothetical protein